MQPVVTLFKTEFSGYSQLFKQLNIHSGEVGECEFFYTYRPHPGQLTEVLNVLRKNKVPHGIQFETPKHTERKTRPNAFHPELLSI